jgi:hypothetical protein
MGSADLRPRGQVGQGQRHVDVVRHQVEYALVEAPHRMPEQASEVSKSPAVLFHGHLGIVRQTDQKTCCPSGISLVTLLAMHPACT